MQVMGEPGNMILPEAKSAIQEKLKSGRIAIAGLGGLGSNIAVMLARMGVGKLLLVDFDVVEESNLNRQYYDTTHLGIKKTLALKEQIGRINPSVETDTWDAKVEEHNVLEIFEDYPIVCEAFDKPQYKAVLVNALLEKPNTKIVAASGMAGFESANSIRTRRVFGNLYVCGDSEPQAGAGFMAPRVAVCAGHQANMAVRLLLGIEDE